MTEPNAELPEEDPLVSVKLCGPEGCFLNKSKGTVVIANRAKETGDKQGASGVSPWEQDARKRLQPEPTLDVRPAHWEMLPFQNVLEKPRS